MLPRLFRRAEQACNNSVRAAKRRQPDQLQGQVVGVLRVEPKKETGGKRVHAEW